MNFNNAVQEALSEVFEAFNNNGNKSMKVYGKEDLMKAIQVMEEKGFFDEPNGPFMISEKILYPDGTQEFGWVDENSSLVNDFQEAAEFSPLEEAMGEVEAMKDYIYDNEEEFKDCKVFIRVIDIDGNTVHKEKFNI